MGFKRDRRPGETSSQDLQYMAELARSSGDDLASALGLVMLGLPVLERVALIREIVDTLPPAMRAAVYGNAILDTQWWTGLRESMIAAERRPKLVRALIEQGQATGRVDLSAIPADTTVTFGLFKRKPGPVPTPKDLRRAGTLPDISLPFVALGDGRLETGDALYVNIMPEKTHRFPPDHALTLSGRDVEGELTSLIAYGKPLVAQLDAGPIDLTLYDPHGGSSSKFVPCYIGSLKLDEREVFA